MNQPKSDKSYFMINAGHPRAVFAPPADPRERRIWNRWLNGAFAAIGIVALATSLWAMSGSVRPLEAVVRLERLAAKVERTGSIHPNTAHEIARLIALHWHDCDWGACSTELQARNHAVLFHLKTLIATKTPLDGLADAGSEPPPQ